MSPDAKTYTVKNIAGDDVGEISLDDAVFDTEVHEHLLWECVKWQLAKRRAGTHATKRRGEVRGTTRKPYRQKGTGRARAGSQRAAQWVGGGSVFGPKPRSYAYNMPKKARKKALRAALSLRNQEARLVIVDAFAVDGGKTKSVASALAALGAPQPGSSALIVDTSENGELVRGARNLRASKWIAPEGLNVYDILNHETLVLTTASAKAVEQALQP
jgi:large subunit ribosomal protein L4